MTDLQLSLVLVASIWAAVNTLISGYSAVNGTRDRVLTGVTDEGVPLSPAHRYILYRNDWLPLKAGLSAVSLGFAAFIVFLPGLASNPEPLRWICYVAALLPFGSFLGFFALGLSDRRLMLLTLEGAKEHEEVALAKGPASRIGAEV
jgi:hypothetical protein